MHAKIKIIKMNCSMTSKNIPENNNSINPLEILLKLTDNIPEQIICSEYNPESSMCERYNKICIYKEGWKNL